MVMRVDDKTVMTVNEMKDKYPTKWFRYATVGEPSCTNPGNETGYVVFIADTEVELYDVSKHGYVGEPLSFGKGGNTISTPEVGDIYYHD